MWIRVPGEMAQGEILRLEGVYLSAIRERGTIKRPRRGESGKFMDDLLKPDGKRQFLDGWMRARGRVRTESAKCLCSGWTSTSFL